MSAPLPGRRRARERIGGDEARRWARQLDLGNPYAKSIMLAAANYMNEEGTAYPGTATLARDTDISEDTVVKRLRWLAEIGAIALFKCWRDEHGQRNYDGRGKPTSSEIRFLFDADPDDIRARARGQHPGDDGCETSEASPRPERGLDQEAQPPASPRLAPDQPPKSDPSETGVHMNARARLELEQESQPQTPSQSEGAFDRVASRLSEFQEAYPIPVTDLAKTEIQWQGLTDEERNDAITGARGYASLLKAQPKRTAEDAHRWLRGRKWQGYLSAGKQAEATLRRWRAIEGDEHWQAWEIYYRICGFRGIPDFLITGSEPNRSANLPCEWPPAGRGLDPDRSKWVERVEGTGSFAAWLRVLTSIENSRLLFGQKIDGSRYLRTLRTPSEWPPGKAAAA